MVLCDGTLKVLLVVAERVIVPVIVVVTFVTGIDIFPATVIPNVPAKVITPSSGELPGDTVKSKHVRALVTVTVNAPVPILLLASKNTLSAAVGAEAPAVPPDVALQFVVVVVQLPVPPTQYLSAIFYIPVLYVRTSTGSFSINVGSGFSIIDNQLLNLSCFIFCISSSVNILSSSKYNASL
jgi:hypothetical protein